MFIIATKTFYLKFIKFIKKETLVLQRIETKFLQSINLSSFGKKHTYSYAKNFRRLILE